MTREPTVVDEPPGTLQEAFDRTKPKTASVDTALEMMPSSFVTGSFRKNVGSAMLVDDDSKRDVSESKVPEGNTGNNGGNTSTASCGAHEPDSLRLKTDTSSLRRGLRKRSAPFPSIKASSSLQVDSSSRTKTRQKPQPAEEQGPDAVFNGDLSMFWLWHVRRRY